MSVLDELRARREQLKNRDLHLDYEVPGYEPGPDQPSDLVIRFNPAPYAAVVQYQWTFDEDELLQLDADTLVKSCREILVREETGKLAPLVKGETTTFADVDQALGFQTDTAREAVFELFPGELAVGEAANRLVRWSRSAHRQADEDLAGKSEGGQSSSAPPADSTSD